MSSDHLDIIAEQIRLSHCANKESGHKCLGECIISSRGIELKCTLCGSGGGAKLHDGAAAKVLKRVLQAAGLDWDSLSAEAQADAVLELRQECCPDCFRPPNSTYGVCACPCGNWEWSEYRGWNKLIKGEKK